MAIEKEESQKTQTIPLIGDALKSAEEQQQTQSTQAQSQDRMAQGEVENAIELDGYYNVLDIAKGSLDPTNLSKEDIIIALHEAHHLDSKVSENGFSFLNAKSEPDYTAFHEYLQDDSNYEDAIAQIEAMSSRPDFDEKRIETMKTKLTEFREKGEGIFGGWGPQDMLFTLYQDNPINYVKGRTSVYTNFMAELESHANESTDIADALKQFRQAEDGGQYDKKQFAKDANRIISDKAKIAVENGELPIDEARIDERTGIAKIGTGIHQMLSSLTGNFAYDQVEDMKDKAYLDYVHDMDYSLSEWEASYVKRESVDIDDRVNNYLEGLGTAVDGVGETAEGAGDAVNGFLDNAKEFIQGIDLSKAGPWVALGAGVLGGSLLFGNNGGGIGGSLVKVAAIAAVAFVGYKALANDGEAAKNESADAKTKGADGKSDGKDNDETKNKKPAALNPITNGIKTTTASTSANTALSSGLDNLMESTSKYRKDEPQPLGENDGDTKEVVETICQ